jgi:hypothetical protein
MSDENFGETDNLLPPRTESANKPDDDNSSLWNLDEPLEEETIEESSEDETENEAEPEIEAKTSTSNDEDESDKTKEAQAPIKFSADLKFELDDGTVLSGEDLKMQRMMHEDYSRKMVDVAETRNQANTYVANAKATADHLTKFTEALSAKLAAQLPTEPDERLLYTGNPVDAQNYGMQMQAYRNAMAFLDDVTQATNTVKSVSNQSNQADIDMYVFEENMKLAEQLPETRSEKGRAKFYKETSDFAKSTFKFSEDEIKAQRDHRVWHVLNYAKKGYEAEKASKSAKAKIAAAPIVKSPPRLIAGKPLSADDEALFRKGQASANYHGFKLG